MVPRHWEVRQIRVAQEGTETEGAYSRGAVGQAVKNNLVRRSSLREKDKSRPHNVGRRALKHGHVDPVADGVERRIEPGRARADDEDLLSLTITPECQRDKTTWKGSSTRLPVFGRVVGTGMADRSREALHLRDGWNRRGPREARGDNLKKPRI